MGSALDSFPSGSYQTGVASVPPVYEKEGTGERRKVTGFLTLLCSEQPCCLLQFFSGLSFLLKGSESNSGKQRQPSRVFFLKPHRAGHFSFCFIRPPSPPGPIKSGHSNSTEASLS